MKKDVWIQLNGRQYASSEKQLVYSLLSCPCDTKKFCKEIKRSGPVKFFAHFESEMQKRGMQVPSYCVYCKAGETGGGVHQHSSFREAESHRKCVANVRSPFQSEDNCHKLINCQHFVLQKARMEIKRFQAKQSCSVAPSFSPQADTKSHFFPSLDTRTESLNITKIATPDFLSSMEREQYALSPFRSFLTLLPVTPQPQEQFTLQSTNTRTNASESLYLQQEPSFRSSPPLSISGRDSSLTQTFVNASVGSTSFSQAYGEEFALRSPSTRPGSPFPTPLQQPLQPDVSTSETNLSKLSEQSYSRSATCATTLSINNVRYTVTTIITAKKAENKKTL